MFFEAANQLVTNLQNGLILLVLGMGTVFVFLAVLIFATKLMGKIVKKFVPEVPETKQPAASAVVTAPAAGNDAEIAAAICAAVVQSRK